MKKKLTDAENSAAEELEKTVVVATSIEEYTAALNKGYAVEMSWELGELIGLMEDETITAAEAHAARNDPAN